MQKGRPLTERPALFDLSEGITLSDLWYQAIRRKRLVRQKNW
ncbi:hypothetical protein QE435_002608 [Rhizobium sp. SORGH_AS 787]|uniref:Uncharacterized protein n=1 Tax=Agrobacterium larrymoorei TaxID=160699 RepID=A0AAJ2BBY6_9HYPH|nr:hypothetical protein [Agrobacterium larrymoorei]MDQ1196898.1 hypothetical protein [Rhizobium sp. SORGH_AS_0787]MDR6103516.1 hypothetical protein [Agrobacterium larrymoorei]